MSVFGLVMHRERAKALALDAIEWLGSRGHEVRLLAEDGIALDLPELGMPAEKIAIGADLI